MKLIELLLITSEHRNMYIWENGEIINNLICSRA